MNAKVFDQLAELAIDFGINFHPGQKVVITSEPIHAEFVSLLSQKLYEKGAAFVQIDLRVPKASVNRSLYQKDEFLTYIPEFQKAQIDQYVKEKWSFIHLDGMEDPQVNQPMNQKRNAVFQKAYFEAAQALMKVKGNGKSAWTVLALPTPKWAEKVTGETGQKALDLLWKDLVSIMRLNTENPLESWKKHSAALQQRCRLLGDRKIRTLHFTAPGTDLRIGLNARSRWVGGGIAQEQGEMFPNLPSEEVFATPDFRLTEGRAKVTRPVMVLGEQVEGAWFEFSRGEVVNFGADYGKNLLESYFAIDPRARFLGEVALVDGSSPIFKTGRVFHNILFDENAACHIALGRGIGMSFEGSDQLSKEELLEAGFNEALVHTDFMIGSEEVSVEGTVASGQSFRIIDRGRFVI